MISPIGVFDSGLGGLSVASLILQRLPHESMIYFADTAHVPYGERSFDEIRLFSRNIVEFLVSKNVKAVVVACNLSSAVALDPLCETFPYIPIIGVIEPGARGAAAAANGNTVGVLGTTGAIKSRAYESAIAKLDPSIKVVGQACPKFVPLVESGRTDSDEALAAAREYVEPLVTEGCKAMVLGCTHYPFLMKPIRSAAGRDVTIVDPAQETVRALENVLMNYNIASDLVDARHEFYASGDAASFVTFGSKFLGRDIGSVIRVSM